MSNLNSIKLEIFKHLFASIAEEMGVVLRKSSYSPNIKERRDFSCAIYDSDSQMVAQAAHIPVHLGSMSLSVKAAAEKFRNDLKPGDVLLLNDPFMGGTHLPDITMITPVYIETDSNIPQLVGYVANRAHHADVGGMVPGSMPLANDIFQEGLIVPPIKLFQEGRVNQALMDLILANVRTPIEREGDLWAQFSANQRGVLRLQELVYQYTLDEVSSMMRELISYTEQMTHNLIAELPEGSYTFSDMLDNNGMDELQVPICVTITIKNKMVLVDFTGSANQQNSGINAVYSITLSAVFYVFRCLLGLDVPNNAGCMKPIRVIAPKDSIVNASKPAPVAGGNVETSQRIVDVLLGALSKACPERIPAASQGTMNNLAIGGWDDYRDQPFVYYETIGGGIGASPQGDGPSAMHSHMTNTLNTPIEALEFAYPLQVQEYSIRRGSGGEGHHKGGNGIKREIRLLAQAHVTLLSDRRISTPYGLAGGRSGKSGKNYLIRDGITTQLPGKGTVMLKPGDLISIQTPGGGGWGSYQED